jgi:beta-xylosidase
MVFCFCAFACVGLLFAESTSRAAESAKAKNFEYKNPVYPQGMPDPCVIRYQGLYYAFGTTGDQRMADDRVFRVLSSPNLVDWKELGGALKPPSDNPKIQYWAPEVVPHDGRFYLYYSQGTLPDLHFEIRVAISDSPVGPYIDTGTPLQDGDKAPFFIDGHPFQDDDGSWYFFYAKDFPNTADGNQAGTGIVVDRLIDMTRLEGKPQVVVRPRHPWTLFEANRMMDLYGGKVFDWHTIEGPWVVKKDGRYYCFYSGSNFQTTNYGLDYVEAESVMGPYKNQGDHARVLSGRPDLVRGPGHHSIVLAPDAKTPMIVYHAWNKEMTDRQMCIDPLVWTNEGPRCAGPSVEPQSLDVAE